MEWKTKPKKAVLTTLILTSSLLISGCLSRTRHVLQQPGNAVTSLEPFKVKGTGPGEDGKPVVGIIEAPAGTVMFVPTKAINSAKAEREK